MLSQPSIELLDFTGTPITGSGDIEPFQVNVLRHQHRQLLLKCREYERFAEIIIYRVFCAETISTSISIQILLGFNGFCMTGISDTLPIIMATLLIWLLFKI
jgi:hypothetical protein